MNRRIIRQTLLFAAVLSGLLSVGVSLWSASAVAAAQPPSRPSITKTTPVTDAPSITDTDILTITKAVVGGIRDIAPGETVTFVITVTNLSKETLENVIVVDDYDENGLQKIQPPSDRFSPQDDGKVITWTIAVPAEDATQVLSYTATAADGLAVGTLVTNTAYAQAEGEDPTLAEPVVLKIGPRKLAKLELTRRIAGDPERAIVAGDTVQHIVTYNNTGTASATNVVIEETFDTNDTKVVKEISQISRDGKQIRGEKRIEWKLGNVEVGATGTVTYEIKLEAGLATGRFEVSNKATIKADGLEPVSEEYVFSVQAPKLNIRQEPPEDLNGGEIVAGDTLRFTIHVENSGTAAAADLVINDEFDKQLMTISDLGEGREEGKAIVWNLKALAAGEKKDYSYQVQLKDDSGGKEAINTARVFMGGNEKAIATMTTPIKPRRVAEIEIPPDLTRPTVLDEKGDAVVWLVGASATVALLVLGGFSLALLHKEQWKENYMYSVAEILVVIVIVEAVLILAMTKGIEQNGAISVLSGIAGYVLGRSRAAAR